MRDAARSVDGTGNAAELSLQYSSFIQVYGKPARESLMIFEAGPAGRVSGSIGPRILIANLKGRENLPSSADDASTYEVRGEKFVIKRRRAGCAKEFSAVPSGLGLICFRSQPNVETLGYFRLSLRDWRRRRLTPRHKFPCGTETAGLSHGSDFFPRPEGTR